MSEHKVSLMRPWFDDVWDKGRFETIHESMTEGPSGLVKAGRGLRFTAR